MNDINEKYRTELKSYFLAYSIPTQKNFEDLIDAMIIQGEDPVAITPGSPVMIRTSGDDKNRDEFIRFYEDFEDDPSWILGKNPGTENFEIATLGATRLSIGRDNGSLGINTLEEDNRAQLDVRISDSDTVPLMIAQSTVNYLAISSLNDNAKVVIGGEIGNFNDKAKLHVTLASDDEDVNPMVIENPNGNNYLSINAIGRVSINTESEDDFIEEQLNVRGNIKAGETNNAVYLGLGDDNDQPILNSEDA
ncbi:MAG: hypothetical protein KDD04_08370, partial [Sinomicrobium sp.]|nr:hypothetical protein [Sinomicrobium sp.]